MLFVKSKIRSAKTARRINPAAPLLSAGTMAEDGVINFALHEM
jgi:hypothetical protein